MAEEEQENSNGGSAALLDVNVDIVAVLGVAELRVSQILQLGRGAVVELERKVGEPVELKAEGKLVAKGEVVVTDEKLAVQITDVVNASPEN
ncbi:MAG: flagellar motor switch protein FliN [Alphaproteobacteria bacterium]|jgi:flagellar motor switch protein FliN/FliY|nr:flagellar motor switch protein FliN [Alphaproteobacteria bacterium]|tara:strand:- start:544 stop:819 length:276 start_codon:yes stop_codon:yes gene_type:complete